MNYFMLAGTSSNVGKTTVTMGVMAAFKRRGVHVKPFKTGPDYIDPMFHSFVTGEKSINLDTWMLDENTIRGLFDRRLEDNDLGILEGVMGLYDGHSLESDIGSSAYLAKTIGAPVILIIDGRGMAKSAAALVKGYIDFDRSTKIAGVIINRISSESHYQLLKEMIEAYNDVTCLGYFPNNPDIVMDSRHLGLVPVEEVLDFREKVDRAGELAEAHIDLDKLLEISAHPKRAKTYRDPFEGWHQKYHGLRIGVPKDRAFNFYYDDNFMALEKAGVEIVSFSPLGDKNLPENLDGLYIGGGFPEVFGAELAENKTMLADIKNQLEEGLPCYAECGGLMYLANAMILLDGQTNEGVGFIDGNAQMTKRLQRFGYVNICAYLGGKSIEIRGHEFHHSVVETQQLIPTAYVISKMNRTWTCGYRKKNVLAGYPHIHFYSNPNFLKALLTEALSIKEGRE
ncbi:cobyrinate a,c-diamide synthase [Acetobacterium bakii]|uniref:Cobyrinate a,c-diamide synthase n=1 Tax=Acetobacterium bakii TaxID=52689 RepID=A0A0L6U001_9FIRM|nr:cobyrinate a,c-diamide synthase [Acetobacterium bakii]KNZ41155.1 cobyrinic acid a,c-diamide synthase [Acetobacterium bakii]